MVEKPAGLLSVPGRGAERQDSVALRLQARWPDARIVHRLDMDTSGLMVVARGAAAHRHLSLQFQQRQVRKRYVAVVAGRLQPSQGEVDLPLACDWPNRPRQKVDRQHGKPSLTRYRVLEHSPDGSSSRVQLEPRTGRSHQLRVHLQALGHPILGDRLYGGHGNRERASRLLLHAVWLGFAHPLDGRAMAFASEAPF